MRTRSVAAALLVAFAHATVSVAGYAQTADDPTVKAARARFNEGVEFFDKGQYENARAAFLQAYALRKHPAVLLNLAQSSLRSGHSLEAARYFKQYLHESSSLTAAQRIDAEKGLAEARLKLGRLEVSAADGTEIFVDGELAGTAPLSDSVDVEPGSHEVKASADSRSVAVSAGQVLPVKFSPSGAAAAAIAPAPVSPLSVSPAPAEAPPSASPATVAPVRGQESAPATSKANTPGLFSRPKTLAPVWMGLGVGAAGGAAAIVFVIFRGVANAHYNNEQTTIETSAMKLNVPQGGLCAHPPPKFEAACSDLTSDQSQVNTDALVANVGLGVAIAGAAFGLGWYLFAPKQDAAPASSGNVGTFLPILGPSMNGLGYGGSF
jgi:hypothetical protein